MKVLFDSQIFSSQVYGGVSRYISSLASNLSSMPGVDAKIIAPYYINAYLGRLPDGIVSGTPITKPLILGNYLRFINQYIGAVQAYSFSPDIIHETYYARYINWSRQALHVLTVYDMIHELFPENFPKNLQVRNKKKDAVLKADRVICISENTRNDLLNIYNLPAERVSVVHLGFEMQPADSDSVIQKTVPEDRPFLLYVGERHGYKNFIAFLRAYANSAVLRENHNIICFGGGTFQAYEKDLLRELNLDCGQVKQVKGGDQLLSLYYQQAELFVFPSLYEGFGIPLLEAMSNQCPVACSNTSSIPEVAGTAACFFDPNDPDSIQVVLENAIQSSEILSDLRKRGLRRIKKFSWRKCAKETMKVYEQTTGQVE
ncbi:MAG: glycosyltransferase family 4 protein [Arenicellales bacterium]